MGRKGEIIEIDEAGDEIVVQAGVMKVTASSKDLQKVSVPDEQKKAMVKNYQIVKKQKVGPKIDLRGKRYTEAQRELAKYLDDALLAGYLEVEIVHGKGTGALQQAVTELLKDHDAITEFRSGRPAEGGTGVTIAKINH